MPGTSSGVQPSGQTRTPLSVGGPTCSVPADYATIQAAVNATGCATITVAAGTYAENVQIGRTLTLRGAQYGHDARTVRGAESVISGGAGAAVTISADNVTVDGFTLNGPVSQGSAAIVMMGQNSGETITENIVNNPGRAASFNTSATTFSRNLVKSTATAGDGFQANSNPVHDVSLTDNAFGGATASNYNADITIIEGNANITVARNSSTGDGTLIALFKTNGALVTANTVTGSPDSSAIYIGGADSNVTVTCNAVTSAGSAVNVANAFGVGPNATVTIRNNDLHANATGIKVGASAVMLANTVVAHYNRLTANTAFGVNNLSPFVVDATSNYWGSASGPGPVASGSGDPVSANVTYAPFLRNPGHTSCETEN